MCALCHQASPFSMRTKLSVRLTRPARTLLISEPCKTITRLDSLLNHVIVPGPTVLDGGRSVGPTVFTACLLCAHTL